MIALPAGSEIRLVAMQGARVHMWAEVEERRELIARNYRVFATGEIISSEWVWVGSCTQDSAAYVWHLYRSNIEGAKP